MTTLYYHGDTPALAQDAKQILIDLCSVYPGHPWEVECKPGLLFITYLLRPTNKRWGMARRFNQFGYSASALKHEAIMAAGEWLERAGLARGPVEVDQEIKRIDGVPDADQSRPDDKTVAGDVMPERTELMPQVFTQDVT